MAITALTIDSIDGNDPSTPLQPPPPWQVNGTVTVTGNDAGGAPLTVASMAYQIDDGPVIGFPPPPNGGSYSFQLTADDLPSTGFYLLTVYATDSAGNSLSTSTLTQVAFSTACPPGCVPAGKLP
jgi:hypothetical protein